MIGSGEGANSGTVNGEAFRPNVCRQTLETAIELTSGDRAKQHGDKRTNHQNIADLWNAYLGFPVQLTAQDVALMMVLLKVARTKSGSKNPDNFVDMAGYAGVAAEIADGE